MATYACAMLSLGWYFRPEAPRAKLLGVFSVARLIDIQKGLARQSGKQTVVRCPLRRFLGFSVRGPPHGEAQAA